MPFKIGESIGGATASAVSEVQEKVLKVLGKILVLKNL